MPDQIIRGYQMPLDHNVRCDGCNIVMGKDAPTKVAYKVNEGKLVGVFHSRACFEECLKEVETYENLSNE